MNNSQLSKLKIKAYSDKGRGVFVGEFKAMFNPTSISKKFEVQYGHKGTFGQSDFVKTYIRNNPRELSLKLILDGTGVSGIGISQPDNSSTVADQIHNFLDLTYYMEGKTHEPNKLVVEWGDQTNGVLSFDCVLSSVNINYTAFNRDGSPLRAELDISLISDEEIKKRHRKDNKGSPDLTHRRLVLDGDTLPLICKEIYGKSTYYPLVARFNRLNNFRNLPVGQSLILPPLEQLLEGKTPKQ